MLTPSRDLVPDKKKGIQWTTILIAVLLGLLSAFLVRSIIHSFFFFPYRIKNTQMAPALQPGDQVTISYGNDKDSLKRGSILLIHHPDYPDEDRFLLARLVGLPGDTLAIRDRRVYINQKELQSKWQQAAYDYQNKQNPTIMASGHQRVDQLPDTLVAPGYIFVLADNRGQSNDSRQFGTIKMELVEGVISLD